MPLLSGVILFLSWIVVLTTNGNFWIVPLLHSASGIMQVFVYDIPLCCDSVIYKIYMSQNTCRCRQQSLFLNERHGSTFSFFFKELWVWEWCIALVDITNSLSKYNCFDWYKFCKLYYNVFYFNIGGSVLYWCKLLYAIKFGGRSLVLLGVMCLIASLSKTSYVCSMQYGV
jgi:hypothetical protein